MGAETGAKIVGVTRAGHAAPRGAAPRGTRGASGGEKAAAAEAIATTTQKTMLAAVIAAGAALRREHRRCTPAIVLIALAPHSCLASSNTAPGALATGSARTLWL